MTFLVNFNEQMNKNVKRHYKSKRKEKLIGVHFSSSIFDLSFLVNYHLA